MYLGNFKARLDSKNRFFLDKRLRIFSDGEFILTFIDRNTLVLRDRKNWKSIDVIENYPISCNLDKILKYINNHSYTVKLDSQGRILIPKEVVDVFDFKDGIIVLGNYDYISIVSLPLYTSEVKEQNEIIKESHIARTLRKNI